MTKSAQFALGVRDTTVHRVLPIFVLLAWASACGDREVEDPALLEAELAGDVWHLVFRAGDGATVLEESLARRGGIGPLGFRTAEGWFYAGRILSRSDHREGFEVVVESSHPSGQRLLVRFADEAPGVVAVTASLTEPRLDGVEAFGIAWQSEASERFFGFGERANAVEQSGQVLESYVSDGPYIPSDRQVVRGILPPPGFRDRDDSTYYPVPWLLSSRGYGLLIDNDETSYFDLRAGDPASWSLEARAAPEGMSGGTPPRELRFRVFAGPQPAEALRRFSEATGRQPPPAAPWIFGPWYQPGGSVEEQAGQLAALRAADAPVSVFQTYLHYLPCGAHLDRREAERERTRRLHEGGVAVTTYFNPMVCKEYEPAFSDGVARGAFTMDASGEPYIYNYFTTRFFEVAQVDFSSAAGVAYYGDLLREAVDDGHDGWMEDFGEYTPLDSVASNGASGSQTHNRYPTQYHCGAFDFVSHAERPLVRFQRSGWTGAAPCAQVVWGGDPTTSWDFDGLRSAVWAALNMGLSGVSLWGSDIGGFFTLTSEPLSDELLTRWVQFGLVSGVMRLQRDGIDVSGTERPQVEDDDQIENWRRYAKLRTQLYPYLESASLEYESAGKPLMRHHVLDYDDQRAIARDDQYLFGPDILTAPVVEPGARERGVYLPPGAWIDLWRSAEFDEPTGALRLRAATVVGGGQEVTLPAPLEELPLLVRAGAVLPLLPPDVDTLADYGEPSTDLVHLRDRADEVHLLAFPRGDWHGGFFRDGSLTASAEAGRFDLEVESSLARTFHLQAALGSLTEPLVPCTILWNDAPLPSEAWRYDDSTRVLQAEFSGAQGRLTVLGDCG
jgi:alpha-glucosidase (family GH31 glycosyl hydrolase)